MSDTLRIVAPKNANEAQVLVNGKDITRQLGVYKIEVSLETQDVSRVTFHSHPEEVNLEVLPECVKVVYRDVQDIRELTKGLELSAHRMEILLERLIEAESPEGAEKSKIEIGGFIRAIYQTLGRQQLGDPITREEDGWYFFDETWSNRCGPYVTEVEARAGLVRYARHELDGKPTPQPTWGAPEVE